MKQPRKVALVDVRDYPRSQYSAYWEIRVLGSDGEGYEWGVRIYRYSPHEQVDDRVDVADTRDEADTAAQEYVIKAMKKYRKPEDKHGARD